MSEETEEETQKTVTNEVAPKPKGVSRDSDKALRPGFRNPANRRSKASKKNKKKKRK